MMASGALGTPGPAGPVGGVGAAGRGVETTAISADGRLLLSSQTAQSVLLEALSALRVMLPRGLPRPSGARRH